MTSNISTITNAVIGLGHAIEDINPIPNAFRESRPSNPVDEKVAETTDNSTDNKEGE